MQCKFNIPKEEGKKGNEVLIALEIEMLLVTFKIPLISICIPSFLPFLSLLTLHTREGMRTECIFLCWSLCFAITSDFQGIETSETSFRTLNCLHSLAVRTQEEGSPPCQAHWHMFLLCSELCSTKEQKTIIWHGTCTMHMTDLCYGTIDIYWKALSSGVLRGVSILLWVLMGKGYKFVSSGYAVPGYGLLKSSVCSLITAMVFH